MACLLAYTIMMPSPDLFKFEFNIKGLFRADFFVENPQPSANVKTFARLTMTVEEQAEMRT
jgi:hypothetical protein